MSIHWDIEEYGSISSTQAVVREKLSEKDEGFVVVATSQSDGKGRHGRVWDSEDGNLFLSCLLKPGCHVSKAGQLSILTAVAVYNTLQHFTGNADVKLKWPNDALIEGRKAAGILIESTTSEDGHITDLIIGIGVNVNSAPSGVGAAINEFTETVCSLEYVRNVLLENLSTQYTLWQASGFEDVRALWKQASYDEGTPVSVKMPGKVVRGAFKDIDEMGNLILLDEQNGVQTITSGDVYVSEKDAS